MKKLFSILLAVFCLPTVFGQTKSVNIDNLRINNIATRIPPVMPLDPLFYHYAAKVTATPTTRQRISMNEVRDAVYIAGQKKVSEPIPGDIVIHIDLGNLVIVSSNISERREEEKDRKGNVTVHYYYKLNVVYKFDSKYRIMRDEEVLFQNQEYSSFFNQAYSSQEYRNRKEASDFWNNNRDVLISEFAQNLSMKTASQASIMASHRYGFRVIRAYDIVKTINEKKHSENEAFRGAAQSLREVILAMTGDKGMDENRVEGLIEYFKSIPQKYPDLKSKADIRLRYAAYYNLCKIYLYLDQPENVGQYADLILSNGHDKKDEERMKKAAKELVNLFERTGIKSRHFDPNRYFEDDDIEGELVQEDEIQTEEIEETEDE